MREIDFHLRFIEHEHRLRGLAQSTQEARASRLGNGVDLARAAAPALDALGYQAVARQLLECRVERAIAHPIKKSHRVAKSPLQVIAGSFGIHQKTENRKLNIDA